MKGGGGSNFSFSLLNHSFRELFFNSLEKVIAVLLGPPSLSGILGGQDSMDALGEEYWCVNLL